MAYFVDRRPNPKDKSIGNRQRFIRRARAHIKEVVDRSIRERNVSDVAAGETISIPTKGIDEPRLTHASKGGRRERVFPGNRDYIEGDRIAKPRGDGAGVGDGDGKEGADSGSGEDAFQFVLSRDEFLELFFEDLELPDFVKTTLKEVYTVRPRRAGHTASGTPANLNVLRTMRNSYARRLALKRPSLARMEALESEICDLETLADLMPLEQNRLESLRREFEELERKRRYVPYIDPFDVRYNRFEMRPEPNSKAVMFCLMDVSGSMGEREKDLAKRFFILLHLFLGRRYERTDLIFVRHTHEAEEVDEQTFFYSRETGGTVVSTALAEMLRIIDERYPGDEWNIYAAQASDGENYSGDSDRCRTLLERELLPLCQYFAYIEIIDERERDILLDSESGAALWRAYLAVSQTSPNFAMKRIAGPGDIYQVFRELFAKQPEAGRTVVAART